MGLPDRQVVITRLDEMISAAAEQGPGDGRASRPAGPAVCVIAIDRSDRLRELDPDGTRTAAVEIARRLDRLVRSVDVLGQLGPDRLVVVARSLAPSVAGALVERIGGAIAMPIQLGGGTVSLQATVGVAFAHPGARGEATLAEAEADVERLRSR